MGLPQTAPVKSAIAVNTAPDRRHGARGDLGHGMAPDQGHEAGDGDAEIGEARHPGCRHMHEDDAVSVALLVVGRRNEQCPEKSDGRDHRRRPSHIGHDGIGDLLKAQRVRQSVHDRIFTLPSGCFPDGSTIGRGRTEDGSMPPDASAVEQAAALRLAAGRSLSREPQGCCDRERRQGDSTQQHGALDEKCRSPAEAEKHAVHR